MKACAWRAYGFKNKDPIHVHAFHNAIKHTRSKLGRWGWCSYGGTEEQVLSDLISDEIEWTVMGKIYSKIEGPWPIRSMVRNQVLKAIDKLVLAAVNPAWKAMSTTVEELRPKLEPKINETVGPIGEAKLQLMNKIKDACMSIIDPALKEHVIPHLAKIIAVIQAPMVDSFKESNTFFEKEVIGNFNVKESADENKKEFRSLDSLPYSWKMYDIIRIADAMYEPLWALNILFSDIYPWSLIWTAHDLLRSKMDNAIYTFEERLIETQTKDEEKDMKAAVIKTRDAVLDDYKTDARQAITFYHRDIIKKIVMPPLQSIIYPAAEAILSPIADAIPAPMQDFLDINDMFERVVEGIIDDTIRDVLEG